MKNCKLTDELNRRFKVAPAPKAAHCPQAFLPIVEIYKELKLVEKAWEEVGEVNSLEYFQKQVNKYIGKII